MICSHSSSKSTVSPAPGLRVITSHTREGGKNNVAVGSTQDSFEFWLVVATLLKLNLNLLWFPGPASDSLEIRKKLQLTRKKVLMILPTLLYLGLGPSCLAAFQSQPEGCLRLGHQEPSRVSEE